ncbi:MAG: hypothetical protein LBB91_01925, partial [Clostridiales bacterium]|jgi:hypothetical protein|nr:hypothetical protein [Clostridiales bacterium]
MRDIIAKFMTAAITSFSTGSIGSLAVEVPFLSIDTAKKFYNDITAALSSTALKIAAAASAPQISAPDSSLAGSSAENPSLADPDRPKTGENPSDQPVSASDSAGRSDSEENPSPFMTVMETGAFLGDFAANALNTAANIHIPPAPFATTLALLSGKGAYSTFQERKGAPQSIEEAIKLGREFQAEKKRKDQAELEEAKKLAQAQAVGQNASETFQPSWEAFFRGQAQMDLGIQALSLDSNLTLGSFERLKAGLGLSSSAESLGDLNLHLEDWDSKYFMKLLRDARVDFGQADAGEDTSQGDSQYLKLKMPVLDSSLIYGAGKKIQTELMFPLAKQDPGSLKLQLPALGGVKSPGDNLSLQDSAAETEPEEKYKWQDIVEGVAIAGDHLVNGVNLAPGINIPQAPFLTAFSLFSGRGAYNTFQDKKGAPQTLEEAIGPARIAYEEKQKKEALKKQLEEETEKEAKAQQEQLFKRIDEQLKKIEEWLNESDEAKAASSQVINLLSTEMLRPLAEKLIRLLGDSASDEYKRRGWY